MEWIPFKEYAPDQQLPPERRCVLVQLAAKPEEGRPAGIAVGYLRIWSAGPWFVVPGVGGTITHWCDCLGDDFIAPLWAGTPSMNRTNTKPAIWPRPVDGQGRDGEGR